MRWGMPQPRFTYAPLGNSIAARCAICSRVSRGLSGIADSFGLHNAMHKNCRRYDMLRFDRADRNNFVDFDDGRRCSHSHDGVEIPRRETVGQIAQLVGCLGLDESIVRVNGHLQDAALPLNNALFFAGSNLRADAHGSVKSAETCCGGSHALAENSLRHEFESHFLCRKLLLKI